MSIESQHFTTGFGQFLRQFQLRPHGSNLLTSGAAFWLFAARVLVFSMAASEALAWGYLGYLFGDDWVRWVTAAIVGLVIFLVVWMIDVSLLTLDRASSEHAERIFGDAADGSKAGTLQTTLGISVRVLIVVSSLTITAPYLSQLVFHKEINQWIRTAATEKIEQERVNIAGEYESLVSSKNAELDHKREKLEDEIAGRGVSKLYGKGAAARAIEDSIAILEDERDHLVKAQSEALSEFEADVEHWSENRARIETKYGLSIPVPSILSNREALENLRKKPEHRQTELAIKAFLGFIFVGLLILKIFEPRSIRFYLSDVLQQEYSRYLVGSFDDILPEAEKSTRGQEAMTPQRLYDFLSMSWAPKRDEELLEMKLRTRKARAREDLVALKEIMEDVEPSVAETRRAFEKQRHEWQVINESYQNLLAAIELVRRDVESYEARRAKMSTDEGELGPEEAAKLGTLYRSRLKDAELKLHELKTEEKIERARLNSTRQAVVEAQEALAEKTKELKRIQESVQSARMQMIHSFDLPDSSDGKSKDPALTLH